MRGAISMTLNRRENAEPLLTCGRIVVRAEKPEATGPVVVYEGIDLDVHG